MTRSERLKLRRELVQGHPDLDIDGWEETRGMGTCPEGHPRLWAFIDNGIHLFCPGGSERKCFERLRQIALEIEEDLVARGDDVRAERRARQVRKSPRLTVDTAWVNEVWTQMHNRSVSEADLTALSPLPIPPEVRQHWRSLLSTLYKGPEIIWIGEPHETSSPEFADNFRSVDQWLAWPTQRATKNGIRLLSAPGPLWCPGFFKPDIYIRSEAFIKEQFLFGFEADRLPLAQQREAIAWFIENGWPIVTVIFSGNKSYHVVMIVPRGKWNPLFAQYKATLSALGFDVSPFRVGGTLRLPGYERVVENQKFEVIARDWQRMIYLDHQSLRDHDALRLAEERNHEKPEGYYGRGGGYDQENDRSYKFTRAMVEWKIAEESQGRVFGYTLERGKRLPPKCEVEKIFESNQAALRAKTVANLLWKLAIAIARRSGLAGDLAGRRFNVWNQDSARRLADILNHERVPRICSGIEDFETRQELDESLELWLPDDVTALIMERFGDSFCAHRTRPPKTQTINLGRLAISYEPGGYVTFH